MAGRMSRGEVIGAWAVSENLKFRAWQEVVHFLENSTITNV
jgi:hypothetical protein